MGLLLLRGLYPRPHIPPELVGDKNCTVVGAGREELNSELQDNWNLAAWAVLLSLKVQYGLEGTAC